MSGDSTRSYVSSWQWKWFLWVIFCCADSSCCCWPSSSYNAWRELTPRTRRPRSPRLPPRGREPRRSRSASSRPSRSRAETRASSSSTDPGHPWCSAATCESRQRYATVSMLAAGVRPTHRSVGKCLISLSSTQISTFNKIITLPEIFFWFIFLRIMT